jgi:prepilin-type N-terminal cleavage/methylation domain-containing protein
MKIRIEGEATRDGGFTLLEVLIALAITGIVISLAGSGLYALMNANQRSQIETVDRLELEQALVFMADEIKMSQQIMVNMPLPLTPDDRFRPASGIRDMQPILILKPASNSGLKNPIIYYLADPPNDSVWLGPKVIYRWGPTLSQNGNYSDGDGRDVSASSANINVEYYNEVVVDRISDRVPTQANIPCESSYTYIPSNLVDRLGFYACIALDQKSVKLWMHKKPNPAAKSQSINALVVTRSN